MLLPHHNLVAWQRADDLFLKVHVISRAFPSYERYELGSQLRRSAFSVAVNIVEGFGRRTRRDRLHFLQIASASLGEVGYCLHAARRLGYLSDSAYADLETEVKRAASPLRGLIDSLSSTD
jgi:four helix bundle protein